MFDHGVAAAMLGGIQRGVGGLDQVAGPLRGIRLGASDADAGRDGLKEAGEQVLIGSDRCPNEGDEEDKIESTRSTFTAKSEVKRLTGARGVDVVYDSVGASTFEKSLNCLRPRGYLVYYGHSSGPVPPFDPAILVAKGSLFLTRPSLAHYAATREEVLSRANDLFRWVGNGELKVRIGHMFRLSEARKAHDELAGRRTTGKVLLLPNDN